MAGSPAEEAARGKAQRPRPGPSTTAQDGDRARAQGGAGDSAGWSELRRPPRRPDVSREAFSRLAVTHSLAVAGDTFVTMALAGSVFFSISPQAARVRVLLFLALTMAPFAIVAPVLGPVLDRSRGGRRAMLILGGASRAVVCVSMSGHLQGLLLFPEAFAVLVLSKAHVVTKSALVPSTVADPGELVVANSRLAVVAVVTGFAAAVPGAIVLKVPFLGARWVTLLAAACFAASAVAAVRIPKPSSARAPFTEPVPADVEEAELHGASVRLSAGAMAVLRAVVGFLTFVVAFAFRRAGAPAWWFGLVLVSSMAGTFVGNVAGPWLRRRAHEERIVLGSLAVVAAIGFVAARAGGLGGFTVLAFAVGAAAAAAKLAFDSIVQRDAPDALRGRTFARFETRFQLVWVLGAFVPVLLPVPAALGMDVIALAAAAAFAVYVGSLSASTRYRRHHPSH